MPTWDARQYLQFANERTQPCRDLVARVALPEPRRVIDLGCGPGNSTAILRERWPGTELTGLDNSADMIATARKTDERTRWIEGDIATWQADAPFDLIFSNAALQWVPDHGAIFPRLVRSLAIGGALAVQMPGNWDAPAHTTMRELAGSPKWRRYFPAPPLDWNSVNPLAFYYGLLSPLAGRLDLWATEYMHILANQAAIVDWYRGTGLRPYLDPLPDDDLRATFCAEFLAAISNHYRPQSDDRVLFPFRRVFLVAYARAESSE